MGRILAVDWGERRIGLAVSDPTRLIARGIGKVEAVNPAQAATLVTEAVREWEAEEVVVGLPLNMDGSEGEAARSARALADEISRRTLLPVRLWDERLTSVQAERTLREGRGRRGGAAGRKARQRGDVDVRAAELLLQSYLDAAPSGPAEQGPPG